MFSFGSFDWAAGIVVLFVGVMMVLASGASLAGGGVLDGSAGSGAVRSRNVCDYKNADGLVPDGVDNERDDSGALVAAMAVGAGVVEIPAGYFRFGNVTIPENVTVQGAGAGTVIRSNGHERVFNQQGLGSWVIRDVAFDGETRTGAEAEKDKAWQSLEGPRGAIPDNNRHAIYAERCYGFTIQNIIAHHFEGAALEFTQTDLAKVGYCDGGVLDNLSLYHNHTGIRFNKRAEYMTATQIHSYRNNYGVIIHGGNITIGSSHFCANETGVFIKDKENGSHGAIVNCLINHNRQYSLHAENVANGHNISGCSVFDGTIRLNNCKGIKIASGTLDCSIIVEGAGVNLINGNYIGKAYMKVCEISEQTIVKDNFTAEGLWTSNTLK